jgi:predicted dehydrogenase
MTAMGIHLTDYYIALFGRVATVQAMTARRKLDWETGDIVTVQLGFEAGMLATLNAILYTPHFIRTHVFGTDKWVEVRSETHPDTPGGKTEFTAMTTAAGAETQTFDWVDTVSANLEAFADAIEGRQPYPIERWEMVHNIEVFEAITKSAANRETVHL